MIHVAGCVNELRNYGDDGVFFWKCLFSNPISPFAFLGRRYIALRAAGELCPSISYIGHPTLALVRSLYQLQLRDSIEITFNLSIIFIFILSDLCIWFGKIYGM